MIPCNFKTCGANVAFEKKARLWRKRTNIWRKRISLPMSQVRGGILLACFNSPHSVSRYVPQDQDQDTLIQCLSKLVVMLRICFSFIFSFCSVNASDSYYKPGAYVVEWSEWSGELNREKSS